MEQAGLPSQVLYLNVRFAERIGWYTYEQISHGEYRLLLGEFVFASALFSDDEQIVRDYAREVLGDPRPESFLPRFLEGASVVEKLRHLRAEALDFCRTDGLQQILALEPSLVGLSSSFHQNCASLALIREVKRHRPEVVTALGGANCASEMGAELLRQFPEVDYIGQGDCDVTFVELVRSLADTEGENGAGAAAPQVAGFLAQGRGPIGPSAAQIQGADLDRMPYPDFDDYFASIQTPTAAGSILPALVMETSRGCWWGAKSHCTFCGLNSEDMSFRSKSAERALAEMKAHVQRHGTRYIAMVDNILDTKYFKTLLPMLAEEPVADVFFETKANLTRSQVELLAQARVHWIQPGIESLSDLTLQLMRKGCTKLQNIQLLKWCAESRVGVNWNYLYGFPGESEEEQEQMVEDAELLHHFHPPACATVLRIDRFSPYFADPEGLGIGPVKVAGPYRHVYPFEDASLKRISYYCEADSLAHKGESAGFRSLDKIAADWMRAYPSSHLVAFPGPKYLHVIDTRRCAQRLWHRLSGLEREVYEYCDETRSVAKIQKAFASTDEGELEKILDSLVRKKLLLRHKDRYLGLAQDARRNGYRKGVESRPSGYVIPPPRTAREEFVRALRSPKRAATALWRRSAARTRGARTRMLSRAIESIVRRTVSRAPLTESPLLERRSVG